MCFSLEDGECGFYAYFHVLIYNCTYFPDHATQKADKRHAKLLDQDVLNALEHHFAGLFCTAEEKVLFYF